MIPAKAHILVYSCLLIISMFPPIILVNINPVQLIIDLPFSVLCFSTLQVMGRLEGNLASKGAGMFIIL